MRYQNIYSWHVINHPISIPRLEGKGESGTSESTLCKRKHDKYVYQIVLDRCSVQPHSSKSLKLPFVRFLNGDGLLIDWAPFSCLEIAHKFGYVLKRANS